MWKGMPATTDPGLSAIHAQAEGCGCTRSRNHHCGRSRHRLNRVSVCCLSDTQQVRQEFQCSPRLFDGRTRVHSAHGG